MNTNMRCNVELIYLIKQMIRIRKSKDVNGYESPIVLDLTKLDRGIIPDMDFLNERLSELAAERVPVEGENTRETVINRMEALGDGKIKIHGSSTDKLQHFLKKISGADGTKAKKALPTIQPPLPHAIAWERMQMIVNELFTVFVFYMDEAGRGGRGIKIDFECLGMRARNNSKPGALWWEFQELAAKNGSYSYTRRDQTKRRKNKEKLTDLLQQRFELSDDPFDQIGDMHYKTKFGIKYQEGYPHDIRSTRVDTGSSEEHSEMDGFGESAWLSDDN